MHILIAPNAFKHSLTAGIAANCIREGLTRSGLPFTCKIFPVGDGGDGTAQLLQESLSAVTIPVETHDPLGRKIRSGYGWVAEESIAIIEMADSSGLRLLNKTEWDPLKTSSHGTGEIILQALGQKPKTILLGVGGSATVDGGSGILLALGMRFLDNQHKILTKLPENFMRLALIDRAGLDSRLANTRMTILCDVDNFLLGDHGAARIFGPQKGADPDKVEKLEAGLERFREVTLGLTGKDMAKILHGGAAGGVAAGLAVFLGANLVNGIEYFLDKTRFDQELEKADIVITGEGSIDRQTLQGKAPYGVARRAKWRSKKVIALAGIVPDPADPSFKDYFDEMISINPKSTDPAEALKMAAENLERTAFELGIRLA